MALFQCAGRDIIVARLGADEFRAIAAECPHQGLPLIDGELEGNLLTCWAHRWQFDLATGNGVNPDDCKLDLLPLKIEQDQIWVRLGDSQ